MNRNAIPGMIAFAPALLLPAIQNGVRPKVTHASLLGFVLSWAPDFVIGFCFPFSILVRPRAWSSRAAANLFVVWSAFTAVALVLAEFLIPLGWNVFDPEDLVGGVGGVALALVVFHALIRPRLQFGDERERPID